MTTVELEIPVPPDQVFALLADGWSYAGWVVGATHIRDVDEGWPAVGTRIHHSVGAWPLQIEDETVVLAVLPGSALELRAKLWPFGVAKVRFELTSVAGGGTGVSMSEKAVSGPGALMPEAVQALFLRPRNRETLRRLADVVLHSGNG
ncbi:SRPBCC family protein [Umezawaea sp. Da 62-37]|uniref:SRPBCC family protein n=1 Tax=Umezawaea sp. Da 62-37 TaxID=3075927 RepID=UPI0028F6FC60|nr:SRPBCC family protein [Umezawaea sp. Da 62-37]WNV92184.1 SRPBCC family protein [Umezawaea sp. Da 62-37]